ncbi:MAG: autotransporter outer membrane beta-barrel domain-containing protein, partial [Proteobacteria bacterium]|nr:autotransporter outer membrane beta-barrel domain-containing protein [Pseudomonadota bacterium]
DFNRGERGGVAVWGRGFARNIDGAADGVAFDGTVPGSVAGVDARVSQNLLAGVGFSSVAAEFDYTDSGEADARDGEYEAELTAVHPYVGYRTEGGANVWAMLGVGEGEVTVKQDEVDDEYVGEVEVQSWGLGFTTLRETVQEGRGQDVSLNWHGDVQVAMVEETPTARTRGTGTFDAVGTTEIEVGRARLGAEVSQVVALDGGGVFSQSFDLAVRHDSGDLAEGGAVEVAGAVGLDLPVGLRLDLSARSLLFHEESVEDWGVRGGVAWVSQPGYGGRGLTLSVVPEWGNVAGRGDALLAGGVEAVAGAGGVAAGDEAVARYGFDVRYGIPLLRGGLLVPYVSGDAGDVGESAVYGGAYNLGRFAAGVEAAAGDDAGNAFIRYQRDF